MANPNNTAAKAAAVIAASKTPAPAAAPEVAAEVEVAAEATPARRTFVTTTEDAPAIAPRNTLRALSPKTAAEQQAGREAIAAYQPLQEAE